MTMLTCAVHAPTAENSQPWEFVVARSEETRKSFGAAARDRWTAGGAEQVRQFVSAQVYADIKDGIDNGGLETAPVVVVVCLDTTRVQDQWAAASIYAATQNLLLAAGSLGYGSCLTTGLTARSTELVRRRLELPNHVVPMAGVFIGRPARVLGAPRRPPASDRAHRERFGASW